MSWLDEQAKRIGVDDDAPVTLKKVMFHLQVMGIEHEWRADEVEEYIRAALDVEGNTTIATELEAFRVRHMEALRESEHSMFDRAITALRRQTPKSNGAADPDSPEE